MLLVNILHAYAIIIDNGRWANKHAVLVGWIKIIMFEKNMGSQRNYWLWRVIISRVVIYDFSEVQFAMCFISAYLQHFGWKETQKPILYIYIIVFCNFVQKTSTIRKTLIIPTYTCILSHSTYLNIIFRFHINTFSLRFERRNVHNKYTICNMYTLYIYVYSNDRKPSCVL